MAKIPFPKRSYMNRRLSALAPNVEDRREEDVWIAIIAALSDQMDGEAISSDELRTFVLRSSIDWYESEFPGSPDVALGQKIAHKMTSLSNWPGSAANVVLMKTPHLGEVGDGGPYRIKPIDSNEEDPEEPKLIEDRVVHWRSPTGKAIYYRKAWKTPNDKPVVITWDLDDNEGSGIINSTEQVVEHSKVAFGDDVVLIHYSPGSDYLTRLHLDEDGVAGWQYCDKNEIADLFDGYVPDISDKDIDNDSFSRAVSLSPLPEWVHPNKRKPSYLIQAEAERTGESPASIILGD